VEVEGGDEEEEGAAHGTTWSCSEHEGPEFVGEFAHDSGPAHGTTWSCSAHEGPKFVGEFAHASGAAHGTTWSCSAYHSRKEHRISVNKAELFASSDAMTAAFFSIVA
jgi:hypothetical protein